MKRLCMLFVALALSTTAANAFSLHNVTQGAVYGFVGIGGVNTQYNTATLGGLLLSAESAPLALQGTLGYQVNPYLGVEATYEHLGTQWHGWVPSVVGTFPVSKTFGVFAKAGGTAGDALLGMGITYKSPLFPAHVFSRVGVQYQRFSGTSGNGLTNVRAFVTEIGYRF